MSLAEKKQRGRREFNGEEVWTERIVEIGVRFDPERRGVWGGSHWCAETAEAFQRYPTQRVTMRICRQSLRDVRHWRSLPSGQGRELHPLPPSLAVLADAVYVVYGGTLGLQEVASSAGSWGGVSFPEGRRSRQDDNFAGSESGTPSLALIFGRVHITARDDQAPLARG